MNRKHFVLLAFISGWIITSCTERIDLFSDTNPTFVVDGTVTNEPGPHYVKIAFTKPFSVGADFSFVNDAQVSIVDNLGNEEFLTDEERGVYKTSDEYTGVIGRSYQLKVELESGVKYESNFERMEDIVPIDDIHFRTTSDEVIFSIDFEDLGEEENYYRWRYEGTYQVFAPETRNPLVSPVFTGPCRIRPDKVAKDCWAKDADIGYLKVSDDRLFNGQSMSNFEIYRTEREDIRFAIGYSALITQRSLTREAHLFWVAVGDQLSNTGSIFDVSNYRITGNVKNAENPDATVLGYFGVSAVSSERVFVGNYDLNYTHTYSCEPADIPGACIRIQCYDCRSHSASSVKDRPVFWPEDIGEQ